MQHLFWSFEAAQERGLREAEQIGGILRSLLEALEKA